MGPHVPPRYGFAALGGCCFGLGVLHLTHAGPTVGIALESVLILGLSGVAFYTVRDLPRWGISRSGQWRAVRIGAGTALGFTGLAAVVWLIWLIGHHAFKLPFLLSFAASLGAAVGSRGSLYAVKADEQLTEAQELATLLSINDRVLRHNIRNELSVALGYLTEIEAADDSPETRAQVATIRDHLESLLDTSERTRRLVSIWQTDARCSVDLVTVVEEEVAQLTAEAPDATIRTELPERCVVRTHPSVRVAFEEALRNAVEHNDDVTVTVRVWRDDAVHLVVADDGCGIPRIERRTLRKSEETPLEHTEGVGLWLIYWAVNRAGGTVEFAENEPGGTAVRIRLPDRPDSDGSAGVDSGEDRR
ncbi:sensor histidine kinase KdpD [Halorubrum sp. GN12_10-3_MGM]|uniref:sensor histidine kinase n=1 Tax=Halorubrum sp. GN12_10-3_MGM TaxID=2518113 RepID=UPI0010F65BF9|nr:HAMP domain-containing sensor histidine kinase [Halorubrum sp. GN12_10-3_MGM]TKX64430.1 HAMP domain-containing histidine kinase [Halorubrum sp. GN12_10-3_MGM]